MSCWEALKTSWAVTKGSYLSHLGIKMVLSLVSMLGLLACFILLPLSLPMLPAGQAAAYEYHFRDRCPSRCAVTQQA